MREWACSWEPCKPKAFVHSFMTLVSSGVLCSKGEAEAGQAGGFACRGQSGKDMSTGPER